MLFFRFRQFLVLAICPFAFAALGSIHNANANPQNDSASSTVQADRQHIVEFGGIEQSDYASNQFPMGLNKTSGVTIHPAKHLANSLNASYLQPNTSTILNDVLPGNHGHSTILQYSLGLSPMEHFDPSKNGFVFAAMEAYSNHRHLRLRPDDVWLAILTQLSSYINTHSEELRGSFVAHEGKKQLTIEYDPPRQAIDYGRFARLIGTMIQDNVVDPELREWITPAFSTTEQHDRTVANIVMMASLQSYFDYEVAITCGIPSVTLLGDKTDYELILSRLEKLRSYGEEPSHFADLLTPVIKRFILSFDAPESDEVISFWNKIFHSHDLGSGPVWFSGWINAFMFWDKDGRPLYPEIENGESRSPEAYQRGIEEGEGFPPLWLDGVKYHHLPNSAVPIGFCTVPVKITGDGGEENCEMLAGSVGMDVTSSGGETADGDPGRLDTLQPRSGWWIYERPEQKAEQTVEFEEFVDHW